MNPCSEKPLLLQSRYSRVHCRPRNPCLVSYELEVSQTIFLHGHCDLHVSRVQEGHEAIDPLQVFLGGDLAQIWSKENRGRSELFNVFLTYGESYLELGDCHRLDGAKDSPRIVKG